MRIWSALIGGLAVVGVSYCLVDEAGAARTRPFSGSVSVGVIERLFQMKDKRGSARPFTEKRDRRFVPSHYGDVFQITAHGEDAVLWFKDGDGVVRNVRLSGASHKPLVVEKRDSKVLQVRE